MRIVVAKTVDYRLWLLRRRGVVQPDQRPAVDALLQDREVATDDIRRSLSGGTGVTAVTGGSGFPGSPAPGKAKVRCDIPFPRLAGYPLAASKK
jgi:hypothetical protein